MLRPWMSLLTVLASASLVPTARAEPAFKRVLVVSQTDDFPDAVKARLLESLSRAIQRGVNRALTQATYGSGSAFKKHDVAPPLSLLATALQHIDSYLEEEVTSRETFETQPFEIGRAHV